MDPRVVKICFKPAGRLWTAVRVGMTLPELFALGLRAKHICRRLPRDHLMFNPALSSLDVAEAYQGWCSTQRGLAALAGHERRRSAKGLRTCMCCRKAFKSDGNYNRLCWRCKDRAAVSYDPW
jgi:hypothetical protein